MNDQTTSPLTEQQLNELETLAKNIPAGPWTVDDSRAELRGSHGNLLADLWDDRLGAYFASLSPDTVRALVAEVRRLRAELAAEIGDETPRLCACGHSNLAHTPPTETDFPPRGGHDEDCAYVGFIGDCTCAATGQPKLYRIEFGPAWPVPPITVDFTDYSEAIRTVTEHAIPHLKPALAEAGRPELADCFFRTDRELTEGSFMWLNLAEGMSAQFCPARLTPAAAAAVPAVPTTTKDGAQ